jgi:serine protease AprX
MAGVARGLLMRCLTMTLLPLRQTIRRKAVWGPKAILASFLVMAMAFAPVAMAKEGKHAGEGKKAKPAVPNAFANGKYRRFDEEVSRRMKGNAGETISVIVTLVPGAQLPPQFLRYVKREPLAIINGLALELPTGMLKQFEKMPEVFRVNYDRPTAGFNYRTSVTVGASTVRAIYGYDGAGIGVAVIDSGVSTWHDDLSGTNGSLLYPYGNQRVRKFVDFVGGRTQPYDDNGHGTHVAGIIGGNGYDSYFGEKAGIAPRANIISLKVLDANGVGSISSMIAAMNWVAQNSETYNIRVVNMSVGARISESFWTDPLTLAAKALADRGIIVVTAAGNFGKNAAGNLQYGGITAPANAPWVITVGASSTNGTLTRLDDTMAAFSSSGPTNIDFGAKPDLVAPGTGTVSLAAPGSTFYATKSSFLIGGKIGQVGFKPYLTLSGTSMAAPVVSGTVALMLQANPKLTPNLVKAILQYTAQPHPGYNSLRQGAGFLNSLGAVRLAKFYAGNTVGSRMPVQSVWSQQLIWGNHRISGGVPNPKANAWATGVVWGAARALDGDNIIWGTDCPDTACDNIIWGTVDAGFDNIIWGTNWEIDNIIWGTEFIGDNIIWGTADSDNIIWGTDCGGADCDNIIWGTSDSDNIIWGTADQAASVVWLQSDMDNIIWGTSADADDIWGSAGDDEVLFPDNEATQPVPDPAAEFGDVVEGVL